MRRKIRLYLSSKTLQNTNDITQKGLEHFTM